MESEHALVVFRGKSIRRVWHDKQWYFSVIDIVEVLTESTIPRRYWADLKVKLMALTKSFIRSLPDDLLLGAHN